MLLEANHYLHRTKAKEIAEKFRAFMRRSKISELACSYSVHIDVTGSTFSLDKISLAAKKTTEYRVQDRRR